MSVLRIRVADKRDLAVVMALERETGDSPQWTETNFKPYLDMMLQDEFLRRCAWVAEWDGVAAGYAVASFLEGDGAAGLDSIATGLAYRRRGVARALVEEAKAWSAEAGAVAIELEVRESNAAARGLYAGMGFLEEGRRKGYYREPTEDAILMGLDVVRVKANAVR